jgi:hypothetical protein
MHLAPTASRRVYQQRVGRVTRRNPGKEAGLVIDFVHPATTHDETVISLHSLLDRDVYRGGAIVVGPVRRGRGRRVRVERRVVPVSADPERRLAVLERELWRIAVENLNYSEQHAWAALAGRVTPGWRRAKAMPGDSQELRRRRLLTCVRRPEPAAAEGALGLPPRDPDAFDDAIDTVGTWSRDIRRGPRLQALATPGSTAATRRRRGSGGWRITPRPARGIRRPALAVSALLGLPSTPRGARTGGMPSVVHAARNQQRGSPPPAAAGVAHTPEARRSCGSGCGGPEALSVARELFETSRSQKRRRKRKKKAAAATARGGAKASAGRRAPTEQGAAEAERRIGSDPEVRIRRAEATRPPEAVRTSRSPESLTPSATPSPHPRRSRGRAGNRAPPRPRGPRFGVRLDPAAEVSDRGRGGRRPPRAPARSEVAGSGASRAGTHPARSRG